MSLVESIPVRRWRTRTGAALVALAALGGASCLRAGAPGKATTSLEGFLGGRAGCGPLAAAVNVELDPPAQVEVGESFVLTGRVLVRRPFGVSFPFPVHPEERPGVEWGPVQLHVPATDLLTVDGVPIARRLVHLRIHGRVRARAGRRGPLKVEVRPVLRVAGAVPIMRRRPRGQTSWSRRSGRDPALRAALPTGLLSVDVDPPGASVRLGPWAPLAAAGSFEEIPVLAGRYSLKASHPGYRDAHQRVRVERDGHSEVRVTLERLPRGLLVLELMPEGTRVFRAETGDLLGAGGHSLVLPLAEGRHELRFEHPRHRVLTRDFEIGARRIRREQVHLQPLR